MKLCKQFANDCNIKFNPSKSKSVCYNNIQYISVNLCGQEIETVVWLTWAIISLRKSGATLLSKLAKTSTSDQTVGPILNNFYPSNKASLTMHRVCCNQCDATQR